MKRILALHLFLLTAITAQAGFGVTVGSYSPSLDENDNSVLIGVDFSKKLTVFGIKLEGFYVDSSGRYDDLLGTNFAQANVDIEAIFAADLMYYPLATTFFVQGGVNYVSLDVESIDFDAVDNQLGLELGLGITLFDKLIVQGKYLYTPDAIDSSAADTYNNLEDNLAGFLVSVGWRF